eukprot:tig00000405_g442.t1
MSVALNSTDIKEVVFSDQHGSVTGFQFSNGRFTFTYTAAETPTSASSVVGIKWGDELDPNGGLAEQHTMKFVGATLSCNRLRVRRDATALCTLQRSSTSQSLLSSDFASYAFNASYVVPDRTSEQLLEGGSIRFGASVPGVGSTGVLNVTFASAIGGGFVAQTPNIVAVGVVASDPLRCSRPRVALGRQVQCAILKDSNSPNLATSDFVDMYGSAPSTEATTNSSGLFFTHTAAVVNGPEFTYLMAWTSSVGSGLAGRTLLSVVAGSVSCAGTRRSPPASVVCTVSAAPNSAALQTADIGAPAVNTSQLIKDEGSPSLNQGQITVKLRALSAASSSSIALHWSDDIGGGQIGIQSFTATIVEALLRCDPRTRPGRHLPCTITPFGISPPIQRTDIFVATLRIGDLQYVSYNFTAAAGALAIGMFIPGPPLVSGNTADVDVNYNGGSVGLFAPVRELSDSTAIVLGSRLFCNQTRWRRYANISCILEQHATSAPFVPTDVLVTAPSIGNITGVVSSENGTLEVFIGAEKLAATGLVTASYSAAVGGGVFDRRNLTVFDGTVTCQSGRLAIGNNVSCAVSTSPGSPPILPADLDAPIANAFIQPEPMTIVGSGVSFVARTVGAGEAVPISVSWQERVGGGGLAAATVDIVAARLNCTVRRREGLPVNCTLAPAPGSPALRASDFLAPTTQPGSAGAFAAYQLAANGSVRFAFTPNALRPDTAFSVRFNASLHPASPHTQFSPRNATFVGARIVLNRTRMALGSLVRVSMQRKAASDRLSTTDFRGAFFDPFNTSSAEEAASTCEGDAASAQDCINGRRRGGVAVLRENGDSVSFDVRPNLAGASVRVFAEYSQIIGGGPVDNETHVAVVAANVTCTTRRISVRSTVFCFLSRVGASPALRPSDITVSVSSTGTLSEVVAAEDSSSYDLSFNFTASEPVDGATISVRYSGAIDPETRHVFGSPRPLDVVSATLACTNLRRHVGARASCMLTKAATSANLRSSDFEAIPLFAGSYGPLVSASGGDLAFNVTATAVTDDAGAPIQLRWSSEIDTANETTAEFTLLVVNVTVVCDRRAAAGRAFACLAFASPNSTTLLDTDFGLAALLNLPSNSTAAVNLAGWTIASAGNASAELRISAPVRDAALQLRWSAAIGGGVIAVRPVEAIGASISCVSARRAVNVSLACLVTRETNSPTLSASDFQAPFVEPAGSGSFAELTPSEGGGLAFTYRPTIVVSSSVVNLRFSPEIDRSRELLPGFAVSTLAATVSCDGSRRTVNSSITCTVARIGNSALLRSSDFAPLNVSSPGVAAFGSFSAVSAVGGAAEGEQLSFTFTPSSLSAAANLSVWFSEQTAPSLRLPVSPPIAVAAIAARLQCPSRDVIVGTSPRCTLAPLAGSATLLPADFQAPAVVGDPETLTAAGYTPTASGGLAMTVTGRRLTDNVQLLVRYSAAVDADAANSQAVNSPVQLQVVGTMRVLSSQFENNGYQISIRFSKPAIRTDASVPATDFLTAETAAALGAGATAFWSASDTLTFEMTANATILPGGALRLQTSVCANDGTGDCFIAAVTVSAAEAPATPTIRASFPEESPLCRSIRIVATPLAGTGRRNLRFSWTCVDAETCDALAAYGVDLNGTAARAGRVTLPSEIRPLNKIYQLSVVGENFLGARSAAVAVSPFKSPGVPPLLTVDGGKILQTKSTSVTTVKVIAQRVNCDGEDPAFYNVDAADAWSWIRSTGIEVLWSLSASVPINTAGVDLTKPTLIVPRGILPPGETVTATMTATDTQQQNVKSQVSVLINVIPEPLTARISSTRGRVSPFRALTLNASRSSDADFTSPAAIAANRRAELAYQWFIYSPFNVSSVTDEGEPIPPTLYYNSTVSSSPLHTFVPSEIGLTPGMEYNVSLIVTSTRFVGDVPFGNATTASASVLLDIASVDIPVVVIQNVFPAQPLFVRPGQPIRIRCRASRPEAPEPNKDWAFSWSSFDGDASLANISTSAIRTTADSSTLIIDSTAPFIARNRIYNLRCTAWDNAEGPAFAGFQDMAIRVIGGPSPGECSIFPESGVALKTQFTVTCSGASSAYSSDPLAFQLFLKTNDGRPPVALSQAGTIPVIRALLPVGSGEDRVISVVVRISDPFGSYTELALTARSTLATALGNSKAERDAAVRDVVTQAQASIASLAADGDSEASLAALANVAVTLNALYGEGATESKDSISTLLGPMLDMMTSIASANATSGQAAQALNVGANLVSVFVRSGDESSQVSLANILTRLLGTLDPCTEYDGVDSIVVSAADSFSLSSSWSGDADPKNSTSSSTSSNSNSNSNSGSSPVFDATKNLISSFATASFGCAVCGDKPSSIAGRTLSLTVASVCKSGNSSSAITTSSSSGNESVPSASVTLPAAFQALAAASDNDTDEGAGVFVTQYGSNPYQNAGNMSAENASAVTFNVKSTILEVEVNGLAVKGLSEPIRFEIPFGVGAENITLPMALVYYDPDSMLWKSCGNITELVYKVGDDGRNATYGVGYCDHLTPFGVGTGVSPPVVPPVVVSGNAPSYQGGAAAAASGVNVAAAIAVPVVLGTVFVAAAVFGVLYWKAKKRLHALSGELPYTYAVRSRTGSVPAPAPLPHRRASTGTIDGYVVTPYNRPDAPYTPWAPRLPENHEPAALDVDNIDIGPISPRALRRASAPAYIPSGGNPQQGKADREITVHF